MKLFQWLSGWKRPPQIFLGDVQMHLDWNLVSSFCHYFGSPVHAEPDPHQLRRYFSDVLKMPLFDPNDQTTAGSRLFHLAITDLRYGFAASLNSGDYWLPLVIRPSVTVYGYLLDIDSGQVLAEKRVTQRPSWVRFANPVLFAWSLLADCSESRPSRPMTDTAANKALKQLKKRAARTAQTGHLLAKTRIS